jgi:hypothetical protein
MICLFFSYIVRCLEVVLLNDRIDFSGSFVESDAAYKS